jgi:hypothetical protein
MIVVVLVSGMKNSFMRCTYCAWNDGRAEKAPSEFCYEGELGFLDFYIFPLAK